jgi:signal transduction histidine kinase
LTGVRLQLQKLASDHHRSPRGDRLLDIERAVASEQRELRLFIDGLKPIRQQNPASAALAVTLEELRARLEREWKVPIVIRVMPIDIGVPPATEQALRSLVAEAIVNAVKHAHPSQVSVDVTGQSADLPRVVVCDDGCGFPVQGRFTHEDLVRSNVGPVSLRERVMSLGGRLAIESMSSGSRVEMTIPTTTGVMQSC